MSFPWKERRQETIFLLFIWIYWNNWHKTTWTTILDNALDLSVMSPNLWLPTKNNFALCFSKYLFLTEFETPWFQKQNFCQFTVKYLPIPLIELEKKLLRKGNVFVFVTMKASDFMKLNMGSIECTLTKTYLLFCSHKDVQKIFQLSTWKHQIHFRDEKWKRHILSWHENKL